MGGMERCRYPGSMSHDTRGNGPWYCRHHFFCGDQSDGGRIVAESRAWKAGELVPARLRPAPVVREPGADEAEAA
jgi:hypothetical protein